MEDFFRDQLCEFSHLLSCHDKVTNLIQGVRFVHAAGIAHFDLKPANIFITASGRLKIGDFGMASFWPRDRRASGGGSERQESSQGFEREGDKMYLAPEILQGKYGKEADIFRYGNI